MTITHIKDLTPDPNNARRHNPRNIGMIEKALNDVGAARSIVVDEHGVVLAGNGLLEAAAQAGIERVRVVDADGGEIIAVRRSNLTAEQKTMLALYDNRTAELADWEPGVLAELADTGVLDSMFFPHELANILEQAGTEMLDADALWKGMPEFEQADKAWKELRVYFANEQDYRAFSELVGQVLTPQTTYMWHPRQEKEDLTVYRAEDES